MPAPRRAPRRPTPESLANAALYYLERYAASEASLRRVLQGKIARYAVRDPVFAADSAGRETLMTAIDAIVDKHKKMGVLNDAAYAEMKVGSMRRSGKSARRISQSLAQKGVKADIVARSLAAYDADNDEAEMRAALALAKRRGWGPFRRGEASSDPKVRAKEIAAFARAGFSFDTAKKILGFGPEDLDEM